MVAAERKQTVMKTEKTKKKTEPWNPDKERMEKASHSLSDVHSADPVLCPVPIWSHVRSDYGVSGL